MKRLLSILLFLCGLTAVAQSPAPAPAQIGSSHTAFLAFAGAPAQTDVQREQTRVLYTSLYQAIAGTGRYQLVATPAAAELCMEFSLLENASFSGFRLAIFDCKLHALLWTLDQSVQPALRSAAIQRNIDAATAQLLSDLNTLASGKIPGALLPKNQKN